MTSAPSIYVIGRDPSCHIAYPVHETRVSRVHARLLCRADGTWVIEDQGSANGVFVNGQRVHHAVVTPQCQILLGSLPFIWPPALLPSSPAPPRPVLAGGTPQRIARRSQTRNPPVTTRPSRWLWGLPPLLCALGVGIWLAIPTGSQPRGPSDGPAVVDPVPRRSPLVSFPKPDRELQQGDVEAIESILRRLEHSTLECTDLDRLTADVRALGVRMAHTQGGSPLESSLPSPKRVRRLMDRLEQRRQDCASEGC